MKKMAVFVEGKTELHFVELLLRRIAAGKLIRIHMHRESGGGRAPLQTLIIQADAIASEDEYYFLIIDCGNDAQVQTRMRRQYPSLTTTGNYSSIICIRDVFPLPRVGEQQLRNNFNQPALAGPVTPELILGVMEVETWFLSEHTHFQRIDAALNCAEIQTNLGFDPQTDDMMGRAHPASDLADCYQLARKPYRKGDRDQIENLDFDEIESTVAARVPDLLRLCELIRTFLT